MSQSKSITEYFYEPKGPEGHRCGYCKSESTSVSNGMWTHHLTCQDYQDLIDRGWRRSGKYCYKPVMSTTCCPLYTIRCHAIEFRLSKSQKKVLKTMNSYLVHGRRPHPDPDPETANAGTCSQSGGGTTSGGSAAADGAELPNRSKSVRPGLGADPTRPPCRKTKELRKERKQKRLMSTAGKAVGGDSGECSSSASKSHPLAKSLDPVGGSASVSFLEIGPDGKKPLEAFISAPPALPDVPPALPDVPPALPDAPPALPDVPPAHKLEMKLIRSSPPSKEFQTTFKESHALFQKYQIAVHGDTRDKCDEKQFRRFLCDSPLIPVKGEPGWSCDYGSYHQHYIIDGKLVMVGVFDILPKCLSSVYVFYDPDLPFLSLGVYSALREIEMTRKMFLSHAPFEYYYMGYYVHGCQKMRYKGDYCPSFLLCPETYRFFPIEQCRPKLDMHKYSRLSEEGEREEVERGVETWLGESLVLFQRQIMPYAIFSALCGREQERKVKEYAQLVGPKVSSRMLLYLTTEKDW